MALKDMVYGEHVGAAELTFGLDHKRFSNLLNSVILGHLHNGLHSLNILLAVSQTLQLR